MTERRLRRPGANGDVSVDAGSETVRHGCASVEGTHGADCQCTRCTGFMPGHALSRRHGAYSEIVISERSAATAEELRWELAEVLQGGDEAALQLCASAIRQAKLAAAALEEARAGGARSRVMMLQLSADARSWTHTADRLLGSLGLNPASRSKIGLNVAQARAVDVDRIELGRLDATELASLRALLAKASGDRTLLELEGAES